MAVAVAKGNHGVCTTDANRESVSRTSGSATPSNVKSITKNLRLAYVSTIDTCNIAHD
tara:strand:+ start:350 stop:523 length:174 start_codon:yes stop_codon:yes gene_type:complete